ncbi:hypothetical protein BJ742DRAFT_843750 [Cladochytrium replicatum]|nr:hypothetical protein BJ742DRAFT_843750 [Cladochytrium replicatum]
MYSRLQKKVVFITGASSGIGEATARAFAQSGSNLVIAARRLELLEALKADLTSKFGIKVHVVQLDVRDSKAVREAVASLPEEFKSIDVLVNNSGLAIGVDKVADISEDAINAMLDTNVKGVLYCIQAILPGMKERGRGHIVNISSVSGKEVYPGGGVYCGSKHALDAITRALRIELVDTPINVTSIDPGMVKTDFSKVRFSGDEKKADAVYTGVDYLTAEDIADNVVYCASRPPHVQIASMTVFPTQQASVTHVHRHQA